MTPSRLLSRLPALLLAVAAAALAGCDAVTGALGIESPEKVAAARDAEGKAIGGACRHAGRAIEDCYALNRKADKAAIFAGWRDMNDYMRENKIDEVAPQIAPNQVAAARPAPTDEAADGKEPPASEARGGSAKGASAPTKSKPHAS